MYGNIQATGNGLGFPGGSKITGEGSQVDIVDKVEENTEGKNTRIYFWVGLLSIYLIWDYVILKNNKLRETVDPANIRANLHNLFVIGFGTVIFVNGFKVLLVKIGALNIPGVSRFCRMILPLFQLG